MSVLCEHIAAINSLSFIQLHDFQKLKRFSTIYGSQSANWRSAIEDYPRHVAYQFQWTLLTESPYYVCNVPNATLTETFDDITCGG